MLFEPSKEHFDRILGNVKHTSQYDSTMMEQGLLNWYFQQDKGGPGKTAWRQVPTNYNCQWVSKRPTEELNQAKILHFKVWQEDVPPEVYKIWRNQLNRVLSYQNQTMNATDIEWVPESQQQYTTSLKKGTFGQKMEKPKEYKIAIYTLLAGNDVEKNYEVDRIIANRQRYIKKWDTIHFIQRKLDEGVQHPVWQKVYDAEKLIKEYDWVWFLDADAYIMNPDISLQELLSKYEQESSYETNLVIANDCNGFNAGSFFVRKSKWTADFIQKWKAMETREDYPNAEMWKEQAALTHLYQTNVNDAQKYIYVVPQRDINSYAGPYCGHGYMPGDFIVHSPGKGYNGVKTFMEEHQYKEV
jgi:alpha-N-acetylglucosamine transferase